MRGLRVPLALSGVAGLLALQTSVMGILVPATYRREAAAWAIQAVGQDWANLVVVGALLWSTIRLRYGHPAALFTWMGCLLYLVYAFAIYAFAVHFNRLFLTYVAVLGLAFWALVTALVRLDVAAVVAPLRDHPRRRGAGRLLVAIGVLFAALWVAEILPHIMAGSAPPALAGLALPANPVHVLDLAFLLPAMVVVGLLLGRQHPWGLLFAVPLLVFSATMGLGILVTFALSATRHLPVPAPAAVLVSVVVAASAIYAALLLRPART